jgi:hypothetical protein
LFPEDDKKLKVFLHSFYIGIKIRPIESQSNPLDSGHPSDTVLMTDTALKPRNRPVNINQRVVDKLVPPTSGNLIVWDTELKGFGVRITTITNAPQQIRKIDQRFAITWRIAPSSGAQLRKRPCNITLRRSVDLE